MKPAHLLLVTALLSWPATASQPIGRDFGPWHVSTITSLSGASGDDASAVLQQGTDAAKFAVRWVQGGRVEISLRINDCNGEDADFERSDSTDPGELLRQPAHEFARRLRADFTDWLKEARLTCRPVANGSTLRLEKLNPAVTCFLGRLRYLAPELAPRPVGDRDAHRR
ncbi:MAG: hypothetical protein ABI810_08620 [Sphingomonas bacterium]